MRTLVDLPDHQVASLKTICAAKKLSRAEVIRQALAAFIETNKAAPGQAFGLWGDRKDDGLAYQKRVRSEW